MAVALREGWKVYPKAVRLYPNGIDIQLHPESAEPIAYANPYREPALRFDSMKDLSDDELTRVLARSAAALCRSIQDPVLALLSPEHVCGTGAVRLAHPVDRDRFPDNGEALERLFDRLVSEPQGMCRIYGALNFGELVNGHTKVSQIVCRSYREDPSRWDYIIRAVGAFNNEAQDLIYQLWVYYPRTGRRGWASLPALALTSSNGPRPSGRRSEPDAATPSTRAIGAVLMSTEGRPV
jgi:hypothetical protein